MKLDLARSLRQKLVAMILLITLVALIIALSAMVGYSLRNYHRGSLSDIDTQAELLGRTIAPALAFDDPAMARENLELLALRPKVQSAAVYTSRGALFASYSRAGSGVALPGLPESEGSRIEDQSLLLFKRIVRNGEILGTVYLRNDYDFWPRVLDYVGISVAVVVATMLVVFLASARLQSLVTGPVLRVAGIAREVVEKGDFSRRAEKLSDDEVGLLVASFNRMLDEIERRTRDLEASNLELGREVAERARAEHEVLRLNVELEQRVRDRTTQLEAANRELESFCYSVSHDLRAPLRAIDGFSQALIEDFPKEISSEAARYLARIRAATQRMGQLIEDLLNLSRVSRDALERKPVELSLLARAVVDELMQREPTRAVEVSIRDEMRCEGDPRLLRTALENLIGNAWKFSAGTERARIEIGSLRDGERVTYFVRDNGAGFDMAYADKLFGAFQRLHSAQEFAGTGIGLATVQRIVHRHGGRIWADAEVGKGAAFYFTLAPGGEAPIEPVRADEGGSFADVSQGAKP